MGGYTLTKAGRRYCEKKQESPKTEVLQRILEQLKGLMKEVEAASHDSEIGLYAGDDVTIATRDDHDIGRMRIPLIAASAKGKFALCDTDQEPVLTKNHMDAVDLWSEVFVQKGRIIYGSGRLNCMIGKENL